jgi:SNF2 family DNA or RNA helicase
LKPNEYSSFWRFYKMAVAYEIIYPQQFHKITGPTHWWMTAGLDAIRPWYVRRLKEEMNLGIPDKIYDRRYVVLEGAHRRAYDQMEKDMLSWVGENEDKPLVAPAVISRLVRLQQMAIATLDFDEENHTVRMTYPAPKVDLACEIVLDNPDSHFVIFSQFKAPLRMIQKQLEDKGVGVVSYTGDDTQAARKVNKAAFMSNDPKTRVMVSTIKAGGVGVDGLQHVCNNAIFLDRDWSPMINFQAEDRLHRGGQVKHPFIIDIMARNSVDAGRKQKVELKWSWIKKMLGDR